MEVLTLAAWSKTSLESDRAGIKGKLLFSLCR